MPELFYILVVIVMALLVWGLVIAKAIANHVEKRTNQAILVAIGYYLIRRFTK